MLDSYSYIAPSRVKTLVVPINNCSESEFNRFIKLMRSGAQEVRLLDVRADPHLHYFNPQTFPNGRVFYDFTPYAPESESIFLHDFEPSRKAFIVLGLGPYRAGCEDESSRREATNRIKKSHPSSIVHNLIYFDTPLEKVSELNPAHDHNTKSTFFHDGSMTHNITALETIMCEITSNFLSSLDSYASSYQNITLRSPVSISDRRNLSNTMTKTKKRISSSSLKLLLSGISNPSGLNGGSDPKSASQYRHTGRSSKILGNFFLLAGKQTDALYYFTDAVANLKKCDDYLWLASALEGIGCCALLLHYSGIKFQLLNALLLSVLNLLKNRLSKLAHQASSHSENVTSKTSTESVSNHSTKSLNRNSYHSPRNSTSSNPNSHIGGYVSSGTDVNSLPVPELIKLLSSKALNYYLMSTSDFENTVPDIVFVESLLRYAKFMVTIYLTGNSLNTFSLDQIVKSIPIPKTEMENLSKQEENEFFLKNEIMHELNKVYHVQLVDMSLLNQCKIYCALASMYSDLGLYRKKGFVLRILLVSLLPKFEQRLNNNDLANDLDEVSHNLVGVLTNDTNAENLRQVFDYLSDVYGLNEQPECLLSNAMFHAQGGWTLLQLSLAKLFLRITEAMGDYFYLRKLCTLLLTRYLHCLPNEDQMRLKEKIELCHSVLPENESLAMPYCDPFLVRNVKLVTSKQSEELVPFTEHDKSGNTESLVGMKNPDVPTNAASSTGVIFDPFDKNRKTTLDREKLIIKDDVYQLKISLQNPYVFDVDILSLNIVTDGGVEVETLSQLVKVVSTNSISGQGSNGTNLNKNLNGVNGSKSKFQLSGGGKRIVSSQTVVDLPSGGNSFQISLYSPSNSLTLAGKSIVQMVIPFKPLNTGELNIVGFDILIPSCTPQYFKIVTAENSSQFQKIKCIGLPQNFEEGNHFDTFTKNLKEGNIDDRVSTKLLSLSVIPPQPSLVLTKLSITNGWIMLLDGEKYQFSATFNNYSEETINYLSFSFWNSLLDALNKRLTLTESSAGSSSSEVYEIEWLFMKSKLFRILNKGEISEANKLIKPNEEIQIDFEMTARKGMNELSIILEYSNKFSQDLSKSFVKSITVPLSITVIPSIDVIGFDVMPFSKSFIEVFDESKEGTQLDDLKKHTNIANALLYLQQNFESLNQNTHKYCLLVIDLRNQWSNKLVTRVAYQFDEGHRFESENTLEPNSSIRLFIPTKRIDSQEVDLRKPIPSLRNKQYVKNYSITEEEEMKLRETFWTRLHILDRLFGSWEATSSLDSRMREGSIDLRGIRLNPKLTETLCYPKIDIVHEVFSEESPDVSLSKSGTLFVLHTEEFYRIKTVITNNSSEPVTGILRNLPYPSIVPTSSSLLNATLNVNLFKNFSIDKKIFIDGLLQYYIGEKITPGSSYQYEIGFIVLERGEYEWGSIFDVFNQSGTKIVCREPLNLLAL